MQNPILKQYHIQHRYYDILKGDPVLDQKCEAIELITQFTEVLINTIPACCGLDTDFALLCAEHIYDGYVAQFELFGSLDFQSDLSHSILGLNSFNNWITANAFVSPIDEDIQIFRDVLLYHEDPNLCSCKASRPYVSLICAVECFVIATAYMSKLSAIKKGDLKAFVHGNPSLDPRFVKPRYFKQYENGEFIYKTCTTFAEHTLLVATLMTSCLKRFPFLAELLVQPAYGFSYVMEVYNSVFKKTLTPAMAKKAYNVLLNKIQ